tara:strand:+ start:432 stop:611 length:180 start_codon:yes stop_codon:yes gene_type:complete
MGKVKNKNGAGNSSPTSDKVIILNAYIDSINNQLRKGRVPKVLFERLIELGSRNKNFIK